MIWSQIKVKMEKHEEIGPTLNFTYIQPSISENNRKADEIKIFQGQIAKNNKRSGDLLSQIKLLEKRSENLAGTLVDRERFDFLLQRFLAAFERFGVEIISITNDVDAESKFIHWMCEFKCVQIMSVSDYFNQKYSIILKLFRTLFD